MRIVKLATNPMKLLPRLDPSDFSSTSLRLAYIVFLQPKLFPREKEKGSTYTKGLRSDHDKDLSFVFTIQLKCDQGKPRVSKILIIHSGSKIRGKYGTRRELNGGVIVL